MSTKTSQGAAILTHLLGKDLVYGNPVPIICDIEANNLDPLEVDKVWVVGFKQPGVRTWSFAGADLVNRESTIADIKEVFNEDLFHNRYYVFHNGFGYDLPLLRSKFNIYINPRRILDTYILSSLYDPKIKGGHSLEAWGERLGVKKIVVEDDHWSEFSPKMVDRCNTDVEITHRLFDHLNKEMFNGKLLENLRKPEKRLF